MPLWLLWLLPAYEAGVWTGLLGLGGRNAVKVRNTLIHGAAPRTALPFVDAQLRKATGTPTKSQAAVASWIARGVRWAVNTQAFEYAILLGVKKRWRNQGQAICSRVRLSL